MSSLNRKNTIALKRYLERHIEPHIPNAPAVSEPWQHVLVVPAYDESPELLSALSQLSASGKILVILVLNRPDSNPDTQTNSALRSAIGKMRRGDKNTPGTNAIYCLNKRIDLFCYDTEQLHGPTPAAQGVGLARKLGCDIALLWQSQGAIASEWICCTDADALLPRDYFFRLEGADNGVAALYPFAHRPGASGEINKATALYELRLHQYVLGLSYARSPYAYHTLGSCIAVRALPYAQVRGYPKRSGGEDFYLLNKLAKLGPINSLCGDCIALESRASHRVPFGTGPAIQKIIDGSLDDNSALFYHPQCFEALRTLLLVAEKLRKHEAQELPQLLIAAGLPEDLAQTTADVVLEMKMTKAILHCRNHGKTSGQFLRQFHQWFDGFKTLKFIHGLREATLPMQSLSSLLTLRPALFPADIDRGADIETLRAAIRKQWQWSTDQGSYFS